jgi:CubicO group peptidase (beta-lactamase class C family)
MSLPDFAQQYLYDPLGISDVEWYMTPGGRAFGGGCQKLRPIDMAKIGLMTQNRGRWRDVQVVSANWISESTAERNPQYGYLWWRWRYVRQGVVYNAIVAAGAGGQRILTIPELRLVVVTTGGYYFDAEPEGYQHVHDLIQNYIIEAI